MWRENLFSTLLSLLHGFWSVVGVLSTILTSKFIMKSWFYIQHFRNVFACPVLVGQKFFYRWSCSKWYCIHLLRFGGVLLPFCNLLANPRFFGLLFCCTDFPQVMTARSAILVYVGRFLHWMVSSLLHPVSHAFV